MTARIPFVDLRPGDDTGLVRSALDRVLARGWFVLGPEVEAFEAAFAAASGAAHAIGVGSGTDAIALLLRAADIGAGDEVIVPAMTAAFTALAVSSVGAVPVIVDIDPVRLTLDPAAAEAAVTPRTRAIVPVHLYGQAADMDSLVRVCHRHSLALIEDCCQAHLATHRGTPVGTFGLGGAFSFYPTKNLGALGDGGAVVTNDSALALRVKRLRNGGQTTRYAHVECGINSRLDELQAAVLNLRLPNLEQHTGRRRSRARLYAEHLPPSVTPKLCDDGHVFHLFPIRTGQRDRVQHALAAAGIETLIHYPAALCDLPAFSRFHPAACPEASRAASELLSLPLHPDLTDTEVLDVADTLTSILEGGRST